MTDSVVSLVAEAIAQNEYLQEVKGETLREVFCRIDGIRRAEFFSAGSQGLRPEFVLTVARIDYSGEVEVEYDGERYAVYRTYPKDSDYIELYCQRKGGVQREQGL